jgi:NADH-quinone oxidoreductase subunit L
VVLAVLSLVGGFIELPHNFGHLVLFSDFLLPVLPAIPVREAFGPSEWLIQLLAATFSLLGVYLAYLVYRRRPALLTRLEQSRPAMALHRFWLSGWGFDKLYDTLVVRPFVFLATVNKNDVIDTFYSGLAAGARLLNRGLVQTQNGILRWYMMGIVVGALLVITLSLLP